MYETGGPWTQTSCHNHQETNDNCKDNNKVNSQDNNNQQTCHLEDNGPANNHNNFQENNRQGSNQQADHFQDNNR